MINGRHAAIEFIWHWQGRRFDLLSH